MDLYIQIYLFIETAAGVTNVSYELDVLKHVGVPRAQFHRELKGEHYVDCSLIWRAWSVWWFGETASERFLAFPVLCVMPSSLSSLPCLIFLVFHFMPSSLSYHLCLPSDIVFPVLSSLSHLPCLIFPVSSSLSCLPASSCRLQVFRTVGRGWGVKALLHIPQGTFVCE